MFYWNTVEIKFSESFSDFDFQSVFFQTFFCKEYLAYASSLRFNKALSVYFLRERKVIMGCLMPT